MDDGNTGTDCCANCGAECVELVQTSECNDGTPWCECLKCLVADERGKSIIRLERAIAAYRGMRGAHAAGVLAVLESDMAQLLASKAA
jgi:hypothetical protein